MSAENGTPTPEPGTIERIRPRALSQRDPGGLAKAAAESKFWKHIQNPAQAMVVMAAGEELGLTPLAAFQGITIIEGKVGYTGNLIATLMRQHEHYDYKVLERTNEKCTLQFLEDGDPIDDPENGKVSFSVEDAKRAELVKPRSNWEKYPRAMCFNRALTEGIRVYFPDLTAGTPVYMDEEIREVIYVEAEVDDATDAEVVPDRPRLDDDTLDQLVKGYEVAGPELGGVGGSKLDGLNILLGSLGYDGHDLTDDFDIREVMAYWSPEQAAEVADEFANTIDRAAGDDVQESEHGQMSPEDEAVDGEIVDEAATGEEAAHADA